MSDIFYSGGRGVSKSVANYLAAVYARYDLNKEYTEESKLLTDAQEMLAILGCYVVRKEAQTLKGYCDLYVCFRSWFIGIELKDNQGKLSKHQEKHIKNIREAGGVAGGCRTLGDILELILSLK